jgi:hypothetical protein
MSSRRLQFAAPMVAVLALAASIAGIVNQFTYDDRYIIEIESPMHSLHGWWRVFQSSYWPKVWGGDGYRPLTILAFRTEWVIGGGSPVVFHAVNIALYVAVSVLVFALAKRVLPTWAAWIAAGLFAVHPVHVEAVANVVGQSELIVAAALVLATTLYVRDRQSGRLEPRTIAIIAVAYVLACLSKEHGIVLPALLVAAELTVIRDRTPLASRARKLARLFLTLGAIALAFVLLRSAVLTNRALGGFQPFTPFRALHISGVDRVLTAISVVPQWVRLLLWPAHLSSEYGPPAIEIAQGLSVVQLPGLLLLLGTTGIGIALRRRQPVISFGIAVLVITLLPSSNFLLPAGIVLAERTLFLPSVGAMLVVGAVVVYGRDAIAKRYTSARVVRMCGIVACGALVAAGLAKSVIRTRVWRDNETLFHQAVIDSPRSYRAHFMLGAWHFENKHQRDGEAEYRRALSLFPYDPFLAYNLAEQYRTAGSCNAALPFYKWTHDLDRTIPLGHTMYAWCLLREGRYVEGRSMAVEAQQFGGDKKILQRLIVIADSAIAVGATKPGVPSVASNRSPSKVPDSVQKAGRKVGRGSSD